MCILFRFGGWDSTLKDDLTIRQVTQKYASNILSKNRLTLELS